MNILPKLNSPVFEKIKRTLDSAYSYVIFEKFEGSPEEDEFQEVFDVISRLKLGIFEWKIHHDKTRGVAILVVKVDPCRTDNILEEFLNMGIPKDITFYSFGSRIEV
jgi:hypothetical protein